MQHSQLRNPIRQLMNLALLLIIPAEFLIQSNTCQCCSCTVPVHDSCTAAAAAHPSGRAGSKRQQGVGSLYKKPLAHIRYDQCSAFHVEHDTYCILLECPCVRNHLHLLHYRLRRFVNAANAGEF